MTDLKELLLNKNDDEFLSFIKKWEIPSFEYGLLPSVDIRAIFTRFDKLLEKCISGSSFASQDQEENQLTYI